MGKPLPPQVIRQLTDKQAEWVRQFVAGANATDAARLAGYAFPEVDGWRLTRIPAVQAAVVQERERVLKVEIGTLVLRRLTNILRNDDEWKDAPATLKAFAIGKALRSEEHTSELQSLMRISYAVFCLKKKKNMISQYIHLTS